MDLCKIKQGIFVQRECRRVAKYTCAKCEEVVCVDHIKVVERESLCINCAAEEMEMSYEQEDRQFLEGELSYSMYRRTQRRKFIGGDEHFEPFDEDDYRDFDLDQVREGEDMEVGDDFFDS